jgi:aminopeptidase N
MQRQTTFTNLQKIIALTLFFAVAASPALAVTGYMPQQGQATPQQQTAPSLPPAKYIPSHDYDMRNIVLNLRFNWDQNQALGTATLTFAPLLVNLRRIELDAANMTFNSIKLSSGTALKYQFDADNEKLWVDLDRPYQPSDVITIVIDYHTNGYAKGAGLQGFGKGLTYIKPTEDEPNKPRQIWSQGETEFNHYWFPCYDHPNDFATTELIATVEKPYMVISNGKLVKQTNNPDGTRTFDWKISEPHASYLTSIVVGEFTPIEQSYDGIPVISYVYPNEAEAGKVTVARMADMVKFFSEKTGVKYPYEKYSQTMVENFPGGMENISATTQTENMIHDARGELDGTSDSLESHELAHQWFGDLVTTRSWTHTWLNESFATYFQAMYDEKSLGLDDFLYSDVKANQDAYLRTWNRGSRRPIVTANYADKDAIFDDYLYPRGGAVLHMLRHQLGEANWWRAINHYLTKYGHQPVETEQFRIAVEEATGQSMDRFFDQWLYRMGHPILQVTKSYDATGKKLTVTVKQEQKPDPASAYPQVTFFELPVDIEIGTVNNNRIEHVVLEPKEEQAFSFPVDADPLLVNFDYHSTLIKELKFDKSNDELFYQLAHDQDVLGRTWAINQLTTKMKDKATAQADVQRIASAIGAALTSDKSWGVRLDSAAALSGIDIKEARASLTAAAGDANARVRARALTSLAAYKDPALAPIFQAHLDDPSYNTIRAAAAGLGATKSPAAYDSLVKLLSVDSWRDNVRAAGLAGLASLGDKRALDLGLQYAAKGRPLGSRAAALALIGAVGKDDPRVFPLLSEAFTSAIESNNFQLAAQAGAGLAALGDPRGIQLFEEASKKSDGPLKGFILQLEGRLKQASQAPAVKAASAP